MTYCGSVTKTAQIHRTSWCGHNYVTSINYVASHCNDVNNFPTHDDVIKWKYFPRYWPFVRGIHRSPVNSPLKGQWRGALMFSLISARINGWVNNGEAGDLRRHRPLYDVIVIRIYYWSVDYITSHRTTQWVHPVNKNETTPPLATYTCSPFY